MTPRIATARIGHPDVPGCALLCLACGVVDAVGYLSHGIFAANMTGNTVLLGLALAARQWPLAVERLLPLAAFFAGAIAGRGLLNAIGGRAPWRLLLPEAALIGAMIAIDPKSPLTLLGIAFAMGIQATAVTRFRGLAVSTVVITSTMARLAESLVDRIGRRAAGAADTAPPPGNGDLLTLSWVAYLAGAFAAGLAGHAERLALGAAALLVLAAAATLALGERRQPA